MKLARSIVLCLLCCCAVFGSSDQLIRKQFAEYFAQEVDESVVEQDLKSIRADGTWEDIDYASKRRGNWPTRKHLTRLEDMAAAYADPESPFFQDSDSDSDSGQKPQTPTPGLRL